MITAKKRAAQRLPEEERERVGHELKQCLRATGLDPALEGLLAKPEFAALWDVLRPVVETRAFEDAADRLRARAVDLADGLERLSALGRAKLGESQAYQAEAAVRLRHYLDSKLLLLAALGRLVLDGQGLPDEGGRVPLIERGAPARMAALDLVDERPAEPALQRLFKDIRHALATSETPALHRALALWPRYLESAWDRLKPQVGSPERARAAQVLAERAQAEAAALAGSPREERQRRGSDALLEGARALGRQLPGLTLDAALVALDWQAPEILRRSPFPARSRASKEA